MAGTKQQARPSRGQSSNRYDDWYEIAVACAGCENWFHRSSLVGKLASDRFTQSVIARRPASVILYRRTWTTLPPARRASLATVAQPKRKNPANIFAVTSLAISAASVTPRGPVFARSSSMRRWSPLRGIVFSYGSTSISCCSRPITVTSEEWLSAILTGCAIAWEISPTLRRPETVQIGSLWPLFAEQFLKLVSHRHGAKYRPEMTTAPPTRPSV